MVNQRKFDQRNLDSDLDGQVDDAEKLQGKQPSDLGANPDNKTIRDTATGIRSAGVLHPSEASNVVTYEEKGAYDISFSVNLNAGEYAILTSCNIIGYGMSINATADGNNIPTANGGFSMDSHNNNIGTVPHLVFEDSFSINTTGSADDVGIALTYLVIQE